MTESALSSENTSKYMNNIADELAAELSNTTTIERTAEVFKALATPSRLRILLLLSHGESPVNAIVNATGLSQPLVSQHLKMLRGMHLVSVHREGREAIYSLKDDHVAHIILDAMAHSVEALNE